MLSVAVDETTIIPYLLQNPANSGLAVKLASRAGLPGADNLYANQFDQLLNAGNYAEAAKIAANSPRGFLRTPQTIERFKALPAQPGQLSVILQYFGMLLDKGSLNKHETLELVRPVLAQNRKHLLEKWMKENKLDCSEELGDIVRPHDLNLALSIYLRANVPGKVVAAFAETGQFDKILPYTTQVGYQPDYVQLLQHIVSHISPFFPSLSFLGRLDRNFKIQPSSIFGSTPTWLLASTSSKKRYSTKILQDFHSAILRTCQSWIGTKATNKIIDKVASAARSIKSNPYRDCRPENFI